MTCGHYTEGCPFAEAERAETAGVIRAAAVEARNGGAAAGAAVRKAALLALAWSSGAVVKVEVIDQLTDRD